MQEMPFIEQCLIILGTAHLGGRVKRYSGNPKNILKFFIMEFTLIFRVFSDSAME